MSTEAVFTAASFRSVGRTLNLHRLADEDLVRLAQRGSLGATERLISLYGGLVRSISAKFFLVGGDKEDVIQEGLVGLFKAIKTYSQTKDTSFRHFAAICVTRQIQTAVRNAARSKHCTLNLASPIQLSEPTLCGTEPSADDLDSIRELITEYGSGLTEFERAVLREILLGKSYSDIGQLLGCPPKSVDNGLQRAKRKIMLNR